MKNEHIYKAIKHLMYHKADKFKKKHGNWLVKYLPHNQIAIMDTWNGYIYQAHQKEVVDDGYVHTQLRGRIHTVITPKECELTDGVALWKLLLN